jgi:hypothetical protein
VLGGLANGERVAIPNPSPTTRPEDHGR